MMIHVETSFEIDLRNFDVSALYERFKDFNRKRDSSACIPRYRSLLLFSSLPKLRLRILFRQQHVSLSPTMLQSKTKDRLGELTLFFFFFEGLPKLLLYWR